MNARSFYPGHEDTETVHTADANNRCARCGIFLVGRSDLRRSADPPPPGSIEALKVKARQFTNPLDPSVTISISKQAQGISRPISPEAGVQAAIERALTPDQVALARKRAEQSIAIALFHTDPRVHAWLLLDPKNDHPPELERAMQNLWQNNAHGWRADAEQRATKMIGIIGAPQHRKGP